MYAGMASEPITTKESTALQNSEYKVGSSCMQGWPRSRSQQKRALLFKIRSTRWDLHVCRSGLGADHNKREHCSSKFGVQGGVFMYAGVASEPITTKESTALQNSEYKVGSSCMQ